MLAFFAPRRESHLEKITVQEKTENTASSARTATSSGFRWTISQRSICRRKAKGASKLNSSPNLKSIINDGGAWGKRRWCSSEAPYSRSCKTKVAYYSNSQSRYGLSAAVDWG